MIKWVLILLLIMAGFASYAQNVPNYTVIQTVAQNGRQLISIRSNINYYAYCHIIDSNGYLVVDFYLNPYAVSRWYYAPYGPWTWRCE